jgi:hypothetical protein
MYPTSHLQALITSVSLVLFSSAVAAQAPEAESIYIQPVSSSTTVAADWRITSDLSINGAAGALDGVARISFTTGGANLFCSGSLLQGGAYVLTAAHCADSFTSMKVDFGYFGGSALVTRTVAVGDAILHPLWQGWVQSGNRGIDVALLKLDTPVTSLQGYALSQTVDLGKTHLLAGFGATGNGGEYGSPTMADGAYGHWGFNTFDVSSATFMQAFNTKLGRAHDPSFYAGLTYMVDYDNVNRSATNNTLGRIGTATGGLWSSSAGLGTDEALIAGGDSGGGAFVWDDASGTWLLSAVHSYVWDGNAPCSAWSLFSCDFRTSNLASYGDLSGSTAVYSHLDWINSVIAVPEPGAFVLMAMGLFAVSGVARRKAQGQ